MILSAIDSTSFGDDNLSMISETVHRKHWSNGSLKEAYRVSRPKQTALIADTMEKVTEIKNS